LCSRLGRQHHKNSANHLQFNGLVEGFHRQLKNTLGARLARVQWVEYLPWVLLGLKAALQEDSNIPSAELASFTPLSTRPVATEAAESSSVVEALKTSSHVCVFRGVSSPPLLRDTRDITWCSVVKTSVSA
jgi:hypothetical protein